MTQRADVAAGGPRLIAEPALTLIDEPVRIRITGLPSGRPVTVRATMPDSFRRRWRSHASFIADGEGVADLATQRPTSGTYAETDPMGLFWSMAPEPPEGPPSPIEALEPLEVELEAELDGRVVATGLVRRRLVAPAVTRRAVRDEGLAGVLFLPDNPGPDPGILTLTGSAGGLRWAQEWAALLAAHGYAAMALAYFGYEGLPERLHNIPLEYFEIAIRWLRSQPGVRRDRIAAMGISRGGELALLLGASFPELTAVVGYVPSGVLHSAVDAPGEPSWTRGGAPLPYLYPPDARTRRAEVDRAEPVVMAPWFRDNLEHRDLAARATIPVERINGPVLLLSGEDDQMWPSTPMAERVIERLAAHRHPHPVEHRRYPGAGHLFGLPNVPTLTVARHPVLRTSVAYGGTPAGNARAAADAWRSVLEFLARWREQR